MRRKVVCGRSSRRGLLSACRRLFGGREGVLTFRGSRRLCCSSYLNELDYREEERGREGGRSLIMVLKIGGIQKTPRGPAPERDTR